MIEVVAGAGAAASGDSLVVRVAPYTSHTAAREATIGVAVADPALARALTAAMIQALGHAIRDAAPEPTAPEAAAPEAAAPEAAAPEPAAPEPVGTEPAAPEPAAPEPARIRTVRVRSRKRLARDAGRLGGSIAIVPVTARNARHLAVLIDGLRAAGALGVQLVWDGTDPPRAAVEHHVFAALEHARATPGEPPVVLATSDQPVAALDFLVAHRSAWNRQPSTRRDEPR